MAQTPQDLDRPLVRRLLETVRPTSEIGARMDSISQHFLGAPYRDHPLIGSPETVEVFTAALDGFDCVTYVESVLALARSDTQDEFVDNLRRIRYLGGIIGWTERNHYMSSWIRRNRASGMVSDRTCGPGVVARERRLAVVEGLPVVKVTVRSLQKRAFLRRQSEVLTGDLAFFASTRRNLDAFHCGILIRTSRGLALRHAARSRGRVVEQDLGEFLAANRMTGVMLIRPKEKLDEAA